MTYSYFRGKLEKISKKLLQNSGNRIIIPNVNFLQLKNSGGIEVKEKTTILIADDNADFAMTLVNYLEKLGFKHLGFNKRFEHNQPRYTFRLDLTQGIDNITKNLHSTTKKVINKGNLYNLEVLKNDTKYIDDFYETMYYEVALKR